LLFFFRSRNPRGLLFLGSAKLFDCAPCLFLTLAAFSPHTQTVGRLPTFLSFFAQDFIQAGSQCRFNPLFSPDEFPVRTGPEFVLGLYLSIPSPLPLQEERLFTSPFPCRTFKRPPLSVPGYFGFDGGLRLLGLIPFSCPTSQVNPLYKRPHPQMIYPFPPFLLDPVPCKRGPVDLTDDDPFSPLFTLRLFLCPTVLDQVPPFFSVRTLLFFFFPLLEGPPRPLALGISNIL